MTMKAANTITFKDVLVGGVWVASGQSNMEFQLRQTAEAPAAIADAKYPGIRRLKIAKKVSDYPLDDVTAQEWVECNPNTAPSFSAVGYFFARHSTARSDVHQRTDRRPVRLHQIECPVKEVCSAAVCDGPARSLIRVPEKLIPP